MYYTATGRRTEQLERESYTTTSTHRLHAATHLQPIPGGVGVASTSPTLSAERVKTPAYRCLRHFLQQQYTVISSTW